MTFNLRCACLAATLLVSLTAVSAAWTPNQRQDEDASEIRHHERVLEEHTAQTERVRAAVRQTAGEIADVERQLEQARDPAARRDLRIRLENLRVLLLRRTILQRRAELKQQEMAEYLDLVRRSSGSVAPMPPGQSSQERRNALTRRLRSAEDLMQLMMDYQRTAVTDREKARISRLIADQKKVIAGIRQAIDKAQ